MRTTSVFLVSCGCVALGVLACMAGGARAADCAAHQPLSPKGNASQAAPIAEELAFPGMLGAGLVRAPSTATTVEVVLSRVRHHECLMAAAAAANAPKPTQGGGSYRFNMTQGGKRMTADEFDAWMKAQGVRVVKSPTRAEAPAAPQPAPPPPPKKKKR